MTLSRWILLAAALLLLLGAGGTAWRVAEAKRAAQGSTASASSAQSPPVRKSSGTTPRDRSDSPLETLPRHLRDLVRELEKHAAFLDKEFMHGDLLTAKETVTPLIEGLALADVLVLLEFYKDPNQNGTMYGFELCNSLLFEAWGRLDPEGATQSVAERIETTLDRNKSTIAWMILDGSRFRAFRPNEIDAIYGGWASRDPEAALEHWTEYRVMLEDDPRTDGISLLNKDISQRIFEVWAATAPEEAWASLRESPGDDPEAAFLGFLRGLGDGAPWSSYAEELEKSPIGPIHQPEAEAHFAAEWARHEPDLAVSWYLEREVPRVRSFIFRWFSEDYFGQGFHWLDANAAELPGEARSIAIMAALESQSHLDADIVTWDRRYELQDYVPMLRELPRDESTWELLEKLAAPVNPFRGDAARLTADQLRSLLNDLQPPDDVRQRVEVQLMDRGGPDAIPGAAR